MKMPAKNDYEAYATDDMDNGFESLIGLLEENGYRLYNSLDEVLVIYKKWVGEVIRQLIRFLMLEWFLGDSSANSNRICRYVYIVVDRL